jgi:hypothetical protein
MFVLFLQAKAEAEAKAAAEAKVAAEFFLLPNIMIMHVGYYTCLFGLVSFCELSVAVCDTNSNLRGP